MADLIRRLKRLEETAPVAQSPYMSMSIEELEALAHDIIDKKLGRKLSDDEHKRCMYFYRNNLKADTSEKGLNLALKNAESPSESN